MLEPAGALALAGLKRALREGELAEGAAVAVASGANMNFARLGHVAERAQVGEHRQDPHEGMLRLFFRHGSQLRDVTGRSVGVDCWRTGLDSYG